MGKLSLKSTAKKLVRKITRYGYGQLPIAGEDGFNLEEMIKLKAALDSAEYCLEHLRRVPTFPTSFDLLTFALKHVKISGSYLEFGVASGTTINHISKQISVVVHGFDSFNGLPEDWRPGFPKGMFSQERPVVNTNVELHVGLFDQTLPTFVNSNKQPVAFLHVDCDLYSSTRQIFCNLADRIIPDTVIVFDEYFNHPTWRYDEWLAFQEFIKDQNLKYKYLGYVPKHQQVAVVISQIT